MPSGQIAHLEALINLCSPDAGQRGQIRSDWHGVAIALEIVILRIMGQAVRFILFIFLP